MRRAWGIVRVDASVGSRVGAGPVVAAGRHGRWSRYDRAVQVAARTFDIEGPVQAEVFVVWLRDARIELTGPCGAAPWLIEVGASEHPLAVIDRVVRDVLGEPQLVHSTSWRRDRDAVILTFLVVIGPDQVGQMESAPVGRVELARSEATAAPRTIAHAQVLEHALRHLAWLAQDDAVVAGRLSGPFKAALATYVPEPFRALG